MTTPLARKDVEKSQTWNSESIFSSPQAFDEEVSSLVEKLADIKKFQGYLGEGPDTFLQAMDLIEEISQRATRVRVYGTIPIICMRA